MIADELRLKIEYALKHSPTADQRGAIATFAEFMSSRSGHAVMILRGSAGTGKTTLASAIVRCLQSLGQKLVLLAPTGRAAKVLAQYSGTAAYTVHRRIYRQRTAGDLSSFSLNDNLHADTLFVVDESSMISNAAGGGSQFGSGHLLDDLLQYVYSGRNCRLLLTGDEAQLPPVGEERSAALSTAWLEDAGMEVYESNLHEVLRQEQESGILRNATYIRELLDRGTVTSLPRLQLSGFADISNVSGDELIESLATSYSRAGLDETIVVTRSNKRANIYNQGIRNTVLDMESELCRGDELMVVKNNYYWTEKSERKDLDFIANGDRCVVERVRNVHTMHGFRFAEATVLFPDYDDYELQAMVLLDTLTSESAALTSAQQEQLFESVQADYADIGLKSERMKQLRQDRYYNALQIKFAYAVTCHKAQGGQWSHVYVDQGYMTDDMLSAEYLHWLYTALTRAREKVFLVNWPKQQTEPTKG